MSPSNYPLASPLNTALETLTEGPEQCLKVMRVGNCGAGNVIKPCGTPNCFLYLYFSTYSAVPDSVQSVWFCPRGKFGREASFNPAEPKIVPPISISQHIQQSPWVQRVWFCPGFQLEAHFGPVHKKHRAFQQMFSAGSSTKGASNLQLGNIDWMLSQHRDPS